MAAHTLTDIFPSRTQSQEMKIGDFCRIAPNVKQVITDQLSDFLFTPSEDGNDNLRREGIRDEKDLLSGQCNDDSLVRLLPSAEGKHVYTSGQPYALVTLHRPSNVDDPEVLRKILECLLQISGNLRTVFPVHPRTRKKIAELGIDLTRLDLLGPLAYIEFLALQRNATVVLTDSGGIPGGDNVSWYSMHNIARQHGTANYNHNGNQYSRGTGYE